MPSSSESRTSADAMGSGTPARSSLAAALRAASRALTSPARTDLARGSRRFGSELVRPLFGGEGLRELFQVAAEGYLEVSCVDLDLHILGLWQDGNRRRRGVYAALALGLGHPLDPVRPAFVLEDRIGTVATYLHGDLPVAADLGGTRRQGAVFEAEAVGVTGVHIVEFASEEGRLVAAGAGSNLDDDVFVVVRVAVDELGPDVLGESFDPLLGIPRFGREELPLLRVLGLGDELPRVALGLYRLQQLPGKLGPTPHARVLFSDPGVAPLVIEDVRVREFLR